MLDAITQSKKVALQEPALDSINRVKPAEQQQVFKKQEAEQPFRNVQEVSPMFLEALEKDLEAIHNIGLKFSVHKATGRTIIKVINKDTGTVIREVPPESILNLSEKIDEIMGLVFDKTV